MDDFFISVGVVALTFVGGIVGLLLQKLLPERHTTDRSRDMISAIVGLITLELALVLGTLVGSAYVFYSNQKSEIETLSARALQFDLALERYGPEALPARAALREGIAKSYELFWGNERPDPRNLTVAALVPAMRGMEAQMSSLKPTNEAQKQAIGEAAAQLSAIEQIRLLMSLQLASPVSWPLLIVVISWSVFLFCGFGVLSHANATTITALGIGAFGVASAIFLILGLSEPYTGIFRIPASALAQTIDALAR